MRRGTTTMKMISSTSTTSTSGVMLISDCSPEPEAPPLTCMISASLRRLDGPLGDQTHTLEAGLFDRQHGRPDLAEAQPGVALDHDLGVQVGARRRAEALAETLWRDRLIVDPERAMLVDRDRDAGPLVR